MAKINGIDPFSSYEVYKVLSSDKITDSQKAEYIRTHSAEIEKAAEQDITKDEFNMIMKNRPLERGKPIKNSFTKQGDDIILAKSLGIEKSQIPHHINSVIANNFEETKDTSKDDIEQMKTYVYRHGTKDQVIAFLRYELSDAKNILKNLYLTLDRNSGGLASYFTRPIHRMDNNTLRNIYITINSSLNNSHNAGYIDGQKLDSVSEWALVRIYEIQNDSRLIRAYNIYKDIGG